MSQLFGIIAPVFALIGMGAIANASSTPRVESQSFFDQRCHHPK